MCGLIGIAGDTTGNWKDIFTELLLVDSVRGAHSTGAGSVHRGDSKFRLAKEPGNPYFLFHEKKFEDLMSIQNPSKVLMGHNRFATIGDHTEENAHPFAFEHVMGMHNGTLDKWCIDKLHNHLLYGTDSEAIFATINETSVEKTLKKVSGAWALVWFDRRDMTLNFVRNDKRPLHYCYSEDRTTLIWASETDMMRYVLGRKNKKTSESEFYIVNPNMHYKWKVPTAINKAFDVPDQIKCEGKPYSYTGPPFSHGVDKHKASTYMQTSTGFTVSKKNKNNVIPLFADKPDPSRFRPPYKDCFDHTINKKEFEAMVEEGCAFCGDNTIKWLEFVQIMGPWCGAKQTPFMCTACHNDTDAYDTLEFVV